MIKALIKSALPLFATIILSSSTSAETVRELECPNCTFAQKEELKCKKNCDQILQKCFDDYVKEKSQGTCEGNYTVMGIKNCEALEREASRNPACAEAHSGCYNQCKL